MGYRMLAEKARGQQARLQQKIRLRVPQGIGHRNMLLLNVAADGTCEMTEEDAESFLRAAWERVDAGDAGAAQQSGDPQTARPNPYR